MPAVIHYFKGKTAILLHTTPIPLQTEKRHLTTALQRPLAGARAIRH